MTSNNLVDDNSEIEDEDIQLLIDQMNDDIGIIRARDYIEIDNNLRTGEMLSDDEIIAAEASMISSAI
ncbi:1632_t:CDS:2 [Entrophospora sp. SA101]|nr:1632_t:CDS:2 [Entrophospora sp. SA101]